MASIFHIASRRILLVALLPATLFLAGAQMESAGTTPPAAICRERFEEMLDAVVRIDVWEARFQGGSRRTEHSVGSGVIMSPEGHILTNAHVVSPKTERIRVTLANLERVEAELLGWDHWTDLAIIRIDVEHLQERGFSFKHAEFGDSDSVYPGQPVYAVGTPNGLTRTVTRGIISNTNRFFEGTLGFGGYETGFFNTWLQTDAAINPGNSGGPLVTEDGRVIGINTRSYLGSNNLGFAVPGVIAKQVMERLLRDGEIKRSYIGIKPGPLQDLEAFFNLELNQGMLINSVDPGSPSDKAGLRAGDIVLGINGDWVDGRFPEQLPAIQRKVAELPEGTEVLLEIKRGAETFQRSVVTERLESRVGEEDAFEDWGISVQEISRAVARERQLDMESGVLIMGARPAFPAYRAGIRAGDIITKVNRRPIENLEHLREYYQAYEEQPQQVLLEVSRNHQITYSIIRPDS